MNIPIETPSTGLNDLFFRAADRMRVEGCVNAVAHEGLSLALSCVHEALLDHYVHQLLQRLRSAAPEHRIEVYFPANTESLISRFNEVLASQTLREATRLSGERQSAQIWLVHDAQTLPEQELQLLARLIQNFPGAQIRAILLINGAAPTQQALSAFGRKLLRWEIEPPSDEQAQAAIEVARLQGQSEAMTLLLRRMGKPTRAPAAWLDDSDTVNAPALPSPAASPAPAAQARRRPWPLALPQFSLAAVMDRLGRRQASPVAQTTPSSAGGPLPTLALPLSAWRQRRPLLVAGAGALALSVLLMMWLQPASFGLKGKTQASAVVAAPPPAEPVVAAKTPTAGPTQTPVVSVGAAPVAPPPTDVPDPAAQAQTWLRTMPPQHFVIQHGAMASYEKAEQMLKSYASLREARIVAAYRPGEKLAYFVVVSGPYENAGKAYERFGRKDLPGTSWVRTAQSLQQQLEPTAKETR